MKPFPCFCADCKYSEEERHGLDCFHPNVLAENSYSLGAVLGNSEGVSCTIEREKKFFSVCGIKGKLWELTTKG